MSSSAYPYPDALGRPKPGQSQPHKLDTTCFIKLFPQQFAERFTKVVPDEFWTLEDTADNEHPVAVIACPCGESPSVRLAGLAECKCHRMFWYPGRSMRVDTLEPPSGDGEEHGVEAPPA